MIDLERLLEFYKVRTHVGVLSLIEKSVGLKFIEEKFDVINDWGYRVYISKNLKNEVPILTAHTDTVFFNKPEEFNITGNIIMNKDEKYGLGADCRNGCYIVSELMKSNPDDYIFMLFDDEEVGGIGSSYFDHKLLGDKLKNVKFIIGVDCFDDKIIANYGRYSTEEDYDLKFLDFVSDNGWVEDRSYFTDAQVLMEKMGLPAFVLSIGFKNQHTCRETSDIDAIENTINILRKSADIGLRKLREDI